MNPFRTVQSALFCTLALTLPLTLAQTSTPDPDPKSYRVEMVVFNYLGPDSSDGEIWHRLSPKYASSIDAGVNTKNNLAQVGQYVQYIEPRNLSSIVQKLENDPQYAVLSAQAWLQPLFKKSAAIRVPVGNRERLNSTNSSLLPAFEGHVRLFDARLLFIDVNLRFRASRSNAMQNGGYGAAAFYTIREKRRIKLNEVHYFDHPYFGAIVRVSRRSS